MKLEQLTTGQKHSRGPFLHRFWKKVQKRNKGCWKWTGNRFQSGYGVIQVNKKLLVATRVMWIVTHGELTDDLCVLHSCDNRGCVNPEHLFLGTKGDNAKDCVSKDRHSRGERNGISKLTDEQVLMIRSASYRRRTRDIYDMAEQLGVSYSCVWNVLNRSWNHL